MRIGFGIDIPCEVFTFYYSFPSSGGAYSDGQLTPYFELLSRIFLCADMFPCEDSKIVSVCRRPSVCPYPEKRNHPNVVNISSTLVIDTSMERSSQVLQDESQIYFFKKVEI